MTLHWKNILTKPLWLGIAWQRQNFLLIVNNAIFYASWSSILTYLQKLQRTRGHHNRWGSWQKQQEQWLWTLHRDVASCANCQHYDYAKRPYGERSHHRPRVHAPLKSSYWKTKFVLRKNENHNWFNQKQCSSMKKVNYEVPDDLRKV